MCIKDLFCSFTASEREKERQTDRERDREKERESGEQMISGPHGSSSDGSDTN